MVSYARPVPKGSPRPARYIPRPGDRVSGLLTGEGRELCLYRSPDQIARAFGRQFRQAADCGHLPDAVKTRASPRDKVQRSRRPPIRTETKSTRILPENLASRIGFKTIKGRDVLILRRIGRERVLPGKSRRLPRTLVDQHTANQKAVVGDKLPSTV